MRNTPKRIYNEQLQHWKVEKETTKTTTFTDNGAVGGMGSTYFRYLLKYTGESTRQNAHMAVCLIDWKCPDNTRIIRFHSLFEKNHKTLRCLGFITFSDEVILIISCEQRKQVFVRCGFIEGYFYVNSTKWSSLYVQ